MNDDIFLKVIVDIDCDVYVDDVFVTTCKRGFLTRIQLRKGEFQVRIQSTVNPKYSLQYELFLEYDKILKVSFKEEALKYPQWYSDADIRMIRKTKYTHSFRNVVLGYDLPGEYLTSFPIDEEDLEWTEKLNRFIGGYAVVESLRHPGKCVIDREGKVIIEGYDEIGPYAEGLFGVSRNHRYGFVNKENALIIPMNYDNISSFKEGFALVSSGGKCGFIDTSGNLVIPCEYDECYQRFERGYAIMKRDSKYGVISSATRKQTIPFEYDLIYQSSNPNVFIGKKEGRYGAVRANGSVLYDFRYDSITVLKADGSVVCLEEGNQFFIVKDGQKTILRTGHDTQAFHSLSDTCLIRKDAGNCGMYSSTYVICDYEGNVITEGCYDYIGIIIHDEALSVNRGWDWDVYRRGGGQFGFVNAKGEEIIQCQYQNAREFSSGLAAVNKGGHFPPTSGSVYFVGGKWGYINEKGNEIVPFMYDDACSFYGGSALVKKGQEYFYIDKYGSQL